MTVRQRAAPAGSRRFRRWRSAVIAVVLTALATSGTDAKTPVTDLDDRVALAPLPRQPFALAGVVSIHLASDASAVEKTSADILRRALSQRFGHAVSLRDTPPVHDGGAVIVGRTMSATSRLVSTAEFAALPVEGFLIKAGGNRAVITGTDPAGTVYGVFAFLRRAGWLSAPTAAPAPVGRHIEGWSAGAPERLGPLATASRPFFERRDGGRFTDGRYGETLRQFALGNLLFTHDDPLFGRRKDLYWGHTAGYLLPLGLYRESHPEFFSRARGGGPLPADTAANRVMVCPCSDDAVRISARRLGEWIERQPQARWFAITDGDAIGDCPQCAATDPSPDSSTDRVLRWLNGVAAIAGRTYPDKILYTYAYQQSVAPPLATDTLADNALVFYCPWLWTSRTTSAVAFDHPLNVVAMEELVGWLQRFPHQMGVYDYAGDSQFGFNTKIKALAKQGVRWLYINELHDPFTDFMTTRLRYDPFLDTQALEDEFLLLNYGSTAPVMADYLRLKEAEITEKSRVSLDFFEDASFQSRLRAIVDRLAAAADSAEDAQRINILQGTLDVQATLLRGTPPQARDPARFAADLDRFLALGRASVAAAQRAGATEKELARLWRELRRTLVRLGAKVGDVDDGNVDERLDLLKETRDKLVATAQRQAAKAPALAAATPIAVTFATAAGEASAWRTASTIAEPAPRVVVRDHVDAIGGKRPVAVIAAPLTKLPEVRRGSRAMHGGRFFAERSFDPPIDLGQRRYVDIHLAASTAVPVTVYLRSDFPVKSSLMLGPGEQIVRIDLSAMKGRDPEHPDLPPRSGRLRQLAFDIWPQDILFPHPPAKDVQIAVLGMSAGNDEPRPDRLPYGGQAIWMTQFRANTGFTDTLREINVEVAKLGRRPAGAVPFFEAFTAPAETEAFRTFTEHRLLAPVTAIRTGGSGETGVNEAAIALQRRLEAMFGVALSIDPAGLPPIGVDSGNVVVLGRSAVRAAGAVSDADFSDVGDDGFVIRARFGRIALAGPGANGALYAVGRYLEDHGARFAAPERWESLPDRRSSFLHELVVLDKPFFRNRQVPCGALLTALEPASRWDEPIGVNARAIADSRAIGAVIKTAARRGRDEVAETELTPAAASPLTCYVTAKLLWDPYADTSRLIRDFEEASRNGRRL